MPLVIDYQTHFLNKLIEVSILDKLDENRCLS